MSKKLLGTVLKALYLAGIAAITVIFSIRDSRTNLKSEYILEAGKPVTIESFFGKVPDDAGFITDMSAIDTSVPAVYRIIIHHDIIFDDTVTLRIEDNTGPSANGLTRTVYSFNELPEAKDMVSDVYDLSGISSIEYEKKPDISVEGIVNAPVKLTDNYGNTSVVQASFIVTKDTTAPVIHGIKDISVTQGENPDLSTGIYATDDTTDNISVRIDASKLEISVPGTYEITYIAKDDAGNTATTVSKVTVNKKPVNKTASANKSAVKKTTKVKKKPAYGKVDQLASKLLKKLKRGSDVETARAIFKWVHNNIHYVHNASRLTGKKAAYYGLTRRSGNCRVFAWTSKILLDKAGIRNMIVSRYPVTTRHFWNLVYMNGGWYHCDATPFLSHPKLYFKLTDAQLDKHHKFKKSKYPARATS